MHIVLVPIMEFSEYTPLMTPQQLQCTIPIFPHPSLDPYSSGTSRLRLIINRCFLTPSS